MESTIILNICILYAGQQVWKMIIYPHESAKPEHSCWQHREKEGCSHTWRWFRVADSFRVSVEDPAIKGQSFNNQGLQDINISFSFCAPSSSSFLSTQFWLLIEPRWESVWSSLWYSLWWGELTASGGCRCVLSRRCCDCLVSMWQKSQYGMCHMVFLFFRESLFTPTVFRTLFPSGL